MQSAYAPGPWAVFGKTVSSIDHQHRYAVARVGNEKLTPEANAANARLIAAAPDLLAALQTLLIGCESAGHDTGISWAKEQARDAIARATGADLWS